MAASALLSFTTASWAASTDSSTQGPGRPHSSKVTHRPLPTCSQHLAYKATSYTQRGTERVPRNSTKQYQETAKVRILIFSLGLLNANCGSEHGVTHESVPCLASGANVIPPETWVTGQGSENR